MDIGGGVRESSQPPSLSMKASLRKALNSPDCRSFLILQVFLALTTAVSIGGLVLATVESFAEYHSLFAAMEWASTGVFLVEYLARIWVAEQKLKYLLSFWGLIDLLSIVPSFLGTWSVKLLSYSKELRILHCVRVIRLAKLSRIFIQTHRGSAHDTEKETIILYFMSLLFAIVSLGSLLYSIEGHQAAFANIPLAMSQCTRVLLGGLSSVNPTTVPGEFSILFTRLVGLALFGLLISVTGKTLERILFGSQSKPRQANPKPGGRFRRPAAAHRPAPASSRVG